MCTYYNSYNGAAVHIITLDIYYKAAIVELQIMSSDIYAD